VNSRRRRQAPPATAVNDIVARISRALPAADTARLTEQLAVLTPAQTGRVAEHLRTHPDALFSGDSAGPPGLGKLLDTLAREHPGVQRARCHRCAAVRALPYRLEDTRICARCYGHTHRTVCVRCGELGHPAFRENGGRSLRSVQNPRPRTPVPLCQVRNDGTRCLPGRGQAAVPELRPAPVAYLLGLRAREAAGPGDER